MPDIRTSLIDGRRQLVGNTEIHSEVAVESRIAFLSREIGTCELDVSPAGKRRQAYRHAPLDIFISVEQSRCAAAFQQGVSCVSVDRVAKDIYAGDRREFFGEKIID